MAQFERSKSTKNNDPSESNKTFAKSERTKLTYTVTHQNTSEKRQLPKEGSVVRSSAVLSVFIVVAVIVYVGRKRKEGFEVSANVEKGLLRFGKHGGGKGSDGGGAIVASS